MDLLLSSAEVYKKECLGYLLGFRLEDRFVVEHCITLQSADRKHREVALNMTIKKKVESILERFHRLQIIGDFHSHTPYGELKGLPIPSRDDILSMKQSQIYFIIAINNNAKTMSWKENRDGTISGSAGRFFYKISAYTLQNSGEATRKTRIHCPFPPGFES
jgi:proteasome lid subunit RPN8/RPN11